RRQRADDPGPRRRRRPDADRGARARQRARRALGSAARPVPGLRRRPDGDRDGRARARERDHRRGARGNAARARPRDHRRAAGLGALPPAGGVRAARGTRPERPEARDGALRLRGASRPGARAEAPQAGVSAAASLALEGVRKTFAPGTPNEVRALQGLDLEVAAGSFVIVIGTNGSGKSSLLGAVAGSFPVDAGRLRIAGRDVTRWPEHRRARLLGRVFQNPYAGTAPELSVAENLALAAARGRRRGLGWALGARLRREIAERVRGLGRGLDARREEPTGALSGRPPR